MCTDVVWHAVCSNQGMGLCELSRTKVAGQSYDASWTSDALNTLDAFDFELMFGNCAFKDNLLQSIFVPPTTLNHTTSTRVIPHSFKSGSPRPSTTSGV